jgi:hypothetical protein
VTRDQFDLEIDMNWQQDNNSTDTRGSSDSEIPSTRQSTKKENIIEISSGSEYNNESRAEVSSSALRDDLVEYIGDSAFGYYEDTAAMMPGALPLASSTGERDGISEDTSVTLD